MSTAAIRGVVRQLGLDADAPTDAALLTRYASHGDEAAFAELLRRHGPVVLGVCRRVLLDVHAAEDAFQAVFLVLARKADAIRPPGLVGSWLYGVAVRTANKAKVAAARRWRREMNALASGGCQPAGSELDLADLRAVIDDELGKLPEALRGPVVLCDLGGKTRSEAARELGCPEGTVAARLHRARKLLADRLTRRGVALSATGLGAVLSPAGATAAVSPDLASATLAAARAFIADIASPAVPPTVQTLAEGMLRTMKTGKLKLSLLALLSAGLLVGGGWLWAANDPNTANVPTDADPPPVVRLPQPAAAANGGWREKAVLKELGDLVYSVAFAPDGKMFAAGGIAGDVRVWDAAKREQIWQNLSNDPYPSAVAYSPDGKRFAHTWGRGVFIHNTATWKEFGRIEEQALRPLAVAFGPTEQINGITRNRMAYTDGKAVWAVTWFEGGLPGTAQFGPLSGGPKIEGTPPAGVAYSRDGKRLVFIPNHKVDPAMPFGKPDPLKATHWTAQVWGGGSGEAMMTIPHETDPVTAIAWSPDGKQIATAGANGNVILWDAESGKEQHRLGTEKSRVHALAFAPDGKTLAATESPGGAGRGRVILIDPATGLLKLTLRDFPNAPPVAVAFAPDGKTLIVGCGTRDAEKRKLPLAERKKLGEVRILTMEASREKPQAALDDKKPEPAAATWEQRKTFDTPGVLVNAVAYSPSGKSIAFCGNSDKVELHDAVTFQERTEFRIKEAESAVYGISFLPQGLMIAVTNRNSFSSRGIAENGIANVPAPPHWAGQFSAIAYSPDGKQLAVSDGFAVRVVDTMTDKEVATFGKVSGKDPPVAPSGLAWSPDSQHIAAIRNVKVGGKWAVSIVDVRKGEVREVAAHEQPVTAVAWSKDGKAIVTGGQDGTAIVWDAATLREVRRMPATTMMGTVGQVFSVAISPDGQTIAAGVEWNFLEMDEYVPPTQEVVLWNAAGEELTRFKGKGNAQFTSLAFSPDGTALAAARGSAIWSPKPVSLKDGSIVIWERKP